MFTGFDGSANVHGSENGGGCEEDDIDVGVDKLLVSVEADERGFVGDGYAIGCVLFEPGERCLEVVGEGVCHGDEMRAGVGIEGLGGSAGSASAAADEADANDIGAGLVSGSGHGGGLVENGGSDCGYAD